MGPELNLQPRAHEASVMTTTPSVAYTHKSKKAIYNLRVLLKADRQFSIGVLVAEVSWYSQWPLANYAK